MNIGPKIRRLLAQFGLIKVKVSDILALSSSNNGKDKERYYRNKYRNELRDKLLDFAAIINDLNKHGYTASMMINYVESHSRYQGYSRAIVIIGDKSWKPDDVYVFGMVVIRNVNGYFASIGESCALNWSLVSKSEWSSDVIDRHRVAVRNITGGDFKTELPLFDFAERFIIWASSTKRTSKFI
ncbi:hypothetical protein [Azospirillum sp. BE72]|uniref:hypothetical protein n=1 Tax=Azospirillum sp. BE72 TaxID=2817776 RepID=UPI002865DD8D|nr:hypothetical protein [Azospirillum sp. BE72]MDR6775528.1 hypothetical protein [Azospirillum sp. BE72]